MTVSKLQLNFYNFEYFDLKNEKDDFSILNKSRRKLSNVIAFRFNMFWYVMSFDPNIL